MSREMYMRRALVKAFPSIPFVFDKVINDGCHKRRPDMFVDCLTHVVICECDEKQHPVSRYPCESRRTMELFEDVARRPTVFVRLNPDSYISGGKRIKGCFREDLNKDGEKVLTPLPEWKIRAEELCRVFGSALTTVPTREITDVRLFYNE